MADTPTSPKRLGRPLGRSGTLNYNGIITQEEYNRNLIGRYGNQQYEIMRRSDSAVRSTLQVCKLPVQSTNYSVAGAKNKDGVVEEKDQYVADFVKKELFNTKINFPDLIRQMLTCLDFGFSVHEKTYEPRVYDGQTMIGIASIASRKQVSIQYWQTADGKPGVQQVISGEPDVSIPMEKLLVTSFDKEGDNWAGNSLLRYVYKDWKIRDDLTIVNAIAIEKQAVGVPVVEAREGSDTPTEPDLDKAEEVLSEFRANERSYIILPRTLTLSMLDMKSQSNKEVIPTLQYHDARIMKSILAGFMELGGQSGSGSQALSKDLTSLFMKSEEALAKLLVSSINEQVIKQLCDLNFAELPNGYPHLAFDKIADDDTSVLATALAALKNAGLITPDADMEEHIRNAYNLPAMSLEMKEKYDELHAPVDENTAPKPAATKKDDLDASLEQARQSRVKLMGALAEG